MSSPTQKPFQLPDYIQAIIAPMLRTVAASVTSATGFLRSLVSTAQAAEATTVATMQSFQSTFIGIHASDPTTNINGGPILAGAFYIRSTDGRFRYVSALDGSGNPIWSDSNVLPWPVTPGLFTITGTGDNAGVKLLNTNGDQDIRVLQKDDGHFSIMNETTSTELFSIVGTRVIAAGGATYHTPPGGVGGITITADATSGLSILQIENSTGTTQWGYWSHTSAGDANWNGIGNLTVNGHLVWTAANDGAGSGLDAGLLGGLLPSAYASSSNIQSFVSGCIGAVATAAGFSYSFTTNGYFMFPSWLGGFIIQWARGSGGSGTPLYFPIAFPNNCFNVTVSDSGASPTTWGSTSLTKTSFTVWTGSGISGSFTYIATGN